MNNGTTRRRRTIAGVLAGAMALSAAPIIGLTAPAFAADKAPPVAEPIGEGNVCEGAENEEPFTDVDTSDPSYDEIVCLVQSGITQGTSATTYTPAGTLTRRQMALFLKRLADTANEHEAPGADLQDLPAYDGEDDYPDVADEKQAFKEAIDQLSQVEIALGFEDGTYRPAAILKRRQMAKFIVRELEFLTDAELPAPSGDYFDDDEGDTGETEFNQLAEQGIFIGNGAGTVNPGGELSRRQMANILLRTLQVLFEDGEITGLFGAGFVPATVTVRPELQSASILSTDGSGTRVRFVFDEEITGTTTPVANLFHVYNRDGEGFDGSGTPAIDTTGTTATRSVVVTFTDVTTLSDAAALSVASVDHGAVMDAEGAVSPIGDAPLAQTDPAPGQTLAPDLSTVQDFDPVADNVTNVDFVFGHAAYVVDPAAFFLVTPGGELIECEAVEDPDGGFVGDGSTEITTACPQIPTTGPISLTDVARGGVETGAVSDTAQGDLTPITGPDGNINPLQATDTPDGDSTRPDLVSATLVFNPDQAAGTTDSVIYTFNKDVFLALATGEDAADAGARFRAYDVNGVEVTGSSAARVSGNTKQIVVTFADGELDEAVGASLEGGAVKTQGTEATNQADEEPLTNPGPSSTAAAGRTANPDLLDVIVDDDATTSTAVAIYVFDEDVNLVAAGDAAFYLLLSNGTRLVCNDAEATNPEEEDADETVTCDSFSIANTDGTPSGDTATPAEILSAVAGSVDDDAVLGEDDSLEPEFQLGISDDTAFGNPEGAEVTTDNS